jgi:hypothetical protein
MNTSDFLAAALRNPVNEAIADALFRQALPDAWIVAGCLVQTAWNVLTARPVDYGIDDYDIFYFDPDTSWQVEDAVIGKLKDSLAARRVKIEVRNQARVHLWYPRKHGLPYPALQSSSQGIDRFLTRNTQFGIRRRKGGYDVYAPNGFGDVVGMIARPKPGPNFPQKITIRRRHDGRNCGRKSRCCLPTGSDRRIVGKGALAPCPPSFFCTNRVRWWAHHRARVRATHWLCCPL